MRADAYFKTKGITNMTPQKEESLSEKGKENYDNADLKGKLDIQKQMGVLDDNLPNLIALRETARKGTPICFVSVTTTGLQEEDELMAIHFLWIDGKGAGSKTVSKGIIWRASDAVLENFETNKQKQQEKYASDMERYGKGILKREPRKPFDIFIDNGFDGKAGMPTKKQYLAMNAETDVTKLQNHIVAMTKGATVVAINPEKLFPYIEKTGAKMPKAYDIIDIAREFDSTGNENGSLSHGGNFTMNNLAIANTDVKELHSGADKVNAMCQIMTKIFDAEGIAYKRKTRKTSKVDKTEPDKTENLVAGEDIKQLLEAKQTQTDSILDRMIAIMTETVALTKQTNEKILKGLGDMSQAIATMSESIEALRNDRLTSAPKADFDGLNH